MSDTISRIPFPESILQEPIANEVEYEAWVFAETLTFTSLPRPVSKEITNFYYLGYYKAEVANGGHSQLVYNMDIGHKRSPYLVDGFIAGATEVGAPEFAGLGEEFQNWLQENPIEAHEQTGFTGGRAEFLDDLDDRFWEMNQSLQSKFIQLETQSTDPHELKFLNDCINRKGDWRGDLDALEVIWVLRSGIIMPVSDDLFEATWNSMLSQQN